MEEEGGGGGEPMMDDQNHNNWGAGGYGRHLLGSAAGQVGDRFLHEAAAGTPAGTELSVANGMLQGCEPGGASCKGGAGAIAAAININASTSKFRESPPCPSPRCSGAHGGASPRAAPRASPAPGLRWPRCPLLASPKHVALLRSVLRRVLAWVLVPEASRSEFGRVKAPWEEKITFLAHTPSSLRSWRGDVVGLAVELGERV